MITRYIKVDTSKKEVTTVSDVRCIVESGCYWGPAQANSRVRGGTLVGIGTYSSCQVACQNTPDCIGIDWNGQRVCWLIFSGKVVYEAGTTHYNYMCAGT